MSLKEKINELESQAAVLLVNPDCKEETVSYSLELPDELALKVSSVERNNGAAIVSSGVELPLLETSVFISHLGYPSQRRQRNPVVFSCIYEQNPQQKIQGVQYVAPDELPRVIEFKDLTNVHTGLKSGLIISDPVKGFYLSTLDVARFIDKITKNDLKYSEPPSPDYDAWHDAHDFKLSELNDEKVNVLSGFVRSADALLADQPINRLTSMTKTQELGGAAIRQVFIKSETTTYAEPREHLNTKETKISVTEGDVVHVYKRSPSGLVEIRQYPRDPAERYGANEAYSLVYEADGTLSGAYSAGDTADELESDQRRMGMFEPTGPKLDFFLDRVRLLIKPSA